MNPSPSSESTLHPNDVAFWQSRYEQQQTPWDLSVAAPPFVSEGKRFAQQLCTQTAPLASPPKVCVIGCGAGHDAAHFARLGLHVTGVDFAPGALVAAHALYGGELYGEDPLVSSPLAAHPATLLATPQKSLPLADAQPPPLPSPPAGSLHWIQADLFDLPPQLHHQFHAVIEHTCFCAISPKRREAYVQQVAQLLQPQGFLYGLFWAHGEWGGPPYGTTYAELLALFTPNFRLTQALCPLTSTPQRAHEELLLTFQHHAS